MNVELAVKALLDAGRHGIGRADADARAAQYDDEQAQAEQVDPTVEGGWPA